MKKIFTIAFCFASAACLANISDEDSFTRAIPAKVEKKFAINFPSASNVAWSPTLTNGFMKASFYSDNKTLQAFYTNDGRFVAMLQSVTASSLPMRAQQFIKKYYGDCFVISTLQYINQNSRNISVYKSAKGAFTYFVQLQKNDSSILLQADEMGNVQICHETL